MIGERLRYLRMANRLTQREVADILKIHRTTYAYYETGRSNPDLETLNVLSRIFGVSIDFLVNGTNDSKMGRVMDNPSKYEAADYPEYLSALSPDEKKLVMIYRILSDKDEIIDILNKKYLEEISKSGENKD